jgi:ligand-binding sensor domain-containing protein
MEYKSFYSNISDNSGLAGNTVTDICEDSSGILWIATFGAINRLDQKSLTYGISHLTTQTF